jgi:hypothetical protein
MASTPGSKVEFISLKGLNVIFFSKKGPNSKKKLGAGDISYEPLSFLRVL